MVYKTDCQSCVFNKFTNSWRFGFVDCQLGRFEKFEKMGLVEPDGFTINKLCTACRNQDWGNKFENKEEQLYKELTNVYTLIIVDEEGDNVLEKLKKSLEVNYTVRPKQIIVAYLGTESMVPINDFMKEYAKNKEVKFSIVRFEEQEYQREMIDSVIKNVEGMFYTIQKNGLALNKDTFLRIYQYLEVLLNKALIIRNPPYRFGEDGDYHGLTVNTLYHKRVNGNFGGYIEDKPYMDETIKESPWIVKYWASVNLECIENEENN